MKRLLLTLLIMMLSDACSSVLWATDKHGAPNLNNASSDPEKARQVLTDFFTELNAGHYATADALYGGSYDSLVDFAPQLDAKDHVALWQNGCQVSGLQCLRVKSAVYLEQTADIQVFNVEFSNADGTLFMRPPCCGASETEMPSASQFAFRVQKTSDGRLLVLDLPVYVP